MIDLQPLINELKPMGEVIKNFGPLTAMFGFIFGWWFKRQERKMRSLTAWKMYRDDLHEFAKQTVDIFSEAEALCEADPSKSPEEFWAKRNGILGKISALRDRGKFTIPNTLHDEGDGELPRNDAFAGIRQPLLDCLSAGFHMASAINFKEQDANKSPV